MKKVLFGLMFALAAAFMFTSCASKTDVLQKGVEKAKKDLGLPKEMGGGITMSDIAFEPSTNTINYIFELQAPVFESMKAMAAQPVYNDFFIFSKKDDPQIKEISKSLLEVNGNLVFTYKAAGGAGSPLVFSYGPAVLQKLVDGTLQQPDMSQMQQQQAPAEGEMPQGGEEQEEGDAAEE